MSTLHPDLLKEVLDCMAARGLTRTAFGMNALRDPRFVFDLESGRRQCLPSTVARVREYIATGKAAQPKRPQHGADEQRGAA